MNVIIRKMRPSDIAEVKKLLDICFGSSAWSEDSIRSQLEKTDSSCYTALDGGRIIGYLAFEQIVDEGSIIEIAVHPDRRRRGTAKSLIEAAVSCSSGLGEIFLEVRKSNYPAVSLYEGLGFDRIAVRKNYYADPEEDAVIMKKIIL